MSDTVEMSENAKGSTSGMIGFVIGSIALLIIVVTYSAGPFAPQQTVGVSLGEIAAEAGKSTFRSWLGLQQPEPQAIAWDIDRVLKAAVMVLGVLAILLGAVAIIRRERRTVALWAIGLGSGAVAMQFVVTSIMLIMGAMIICALIYAFGDLLSFG